MEEAAGSNPAGSTKDMAELKPLIAIITCHKFRDRVEAQRATWIPEMESMVPKDKRIDIRFFYGIGPATQREDETCLPVNDSYEALPYKVRAAMKWAIDHGYNAVFKCDDDTFIFPERFVNDLPTAPYVGRLNKTHMGIAPLGWCSGFGYWLMGKALEIIANADTPQHKAEDLWVGSVMSKYGIRCQSNPRLAILSIVHPSQWHSHRYTMVAACEFPGAKMIEFHRKMRNNEPIEYPKKPKQTFQFGRVIRKA